MRAEDYIKELEYAAQHPGQTIKREMERTGKKTVGCFPVYTPEELIYAAGMLPVGMWGGHTKTKHSDKYLQGFCCSVMKNNTEHLYNGDYDILSAIILTAFCDSMKCVVANWLATCKDKKFITTIYPQNRKTEAAKNFLREDFIRIKNELEDISNSDISEKDLELAVDLYDYYRKSMMDFTELAALHSDIIGAKSRALIMKSAWFMDKKDYTNKINVINEYLRSMPEKKDVIKVILTGLVGEPEGLMEILDRNEFVVAGDDFANGTRQFRYISPVKGSAMERLIDRVVNQDGCSLLYDEKKTRGDKLVELVKKHNAKCVIAMQMKFCDPEEFDFPIYKKQLEKNNTPVLYLEVEQQEDVPRQAETRIQSFKEML